jgi:putative adhesin
MRTFTHPHTASVPALFGLTVPHGVIELHAENRADITVTLEPLQAHDQVAAGLIERTTTELSEGQYSVRVPEPAGHTGTTVVSGAADTVTVVQSFGVVTGNVTGLVINGNGAVINGTVINGRAITGGAVRAVVRVPAGAEVELDTTSATTRVFGALESVIHRSISGDFRSAATVRLVDITTVSGDVVIPIVDWATVRTTSGDVRLTATGPESRVTSVSGDITIRAMVSAEIVASTVSGDVTVTSGPDARPRVTARSVSGRVWTGG